MYGFSVLHNKYIEQHSGNERKSSHLLADDRLSYTFYFCHTIKTKIMLCGTDNIMRDIL